MFRSAIRNPKSDIRNQAAALAIVAAAFAAALLPPAARADVVLNEAYTRMPGSPSGEFIELYNNGASAHVFGSDDYLIVVQATAGSVEDIWPLDGLSIASNGFLLFGDDPITGPFAVPTVPDFPFHNAGGTAVANLGDDNPRAFAVVELGGAVPAKGDDIDADDDGVIDYPGLVVGTLTDGLLRSNPYIPAYAYFGSAEVAGCPNGFVRVPDGGATLEALAWDPDDPGGDVPATPDRTYPQPQMTGVVPDQGTNCEILTVTISGSGLVPAPADSTVKLTLSGSPDIYGEITGVTYGAALTVAFNLYHADPGLRDLVLTYPDGQDDTLPDALTVADDPDPSCDVGSPGHLFVSGYVSDNILEFDETGAFVRVFVDDVTPGGGFGAAGMAFGPNGNLFVCSFFGDSVREYDGTTGAFIGDAIPGTFDQASGYLQGAKRLLFTPDGRLLVAGWENDAVLAYDATTFEWLGTFAIGGPSPGGLDGPAGLALGPAGNVFVTAGPGGLTEYWAGKVLEYHAATGRLKRVVASGLEQTTWGLQVAANGNLWVVNYWGDADTHTIGKLLQLDGETGGIVTTADVEKPRGLTIGPNGNVFVAHLGEVLEFDGTTGQLIGPFASSGQLSHAEGIVFKPAPPDPLPAPTITNVSVSEHDACEPLTGVVVTGANLDAGATVMLKDPNEPIGTSGAVVTYVGVVTGASGDGASLTVDFDLDDGARMPGGLWDVVVQNPDGQADTLPAAIDVAPCWTAGEGNLFVLGYRHRGKTRDGLFEFDGAAGDLIGFVVEDPTLDGDDLRLSTGLAFGHDGNLLITARSPWNPQLGYYGSVLEYDGLTGRKLGTFVPAGTGGMMRPIEIRYGPNGDLFVLHSGAGVLEFHGLTGALVRDFVPSGTCGLYDVYELHFGHSGNLYVADSTRTANCDPYVFPNAGVHLFDGVTGACLANPLVPFTVLPESLKMELTSFAIGPRDGLLYLPINAACGTTDQGTVRVHDPDTGVLLGEPIPLTATLDAPKSAAFGPNGHLFVSHYLNGSGIISELNVPDAASGTWLGVFATQTNASGPSEANAIQFKPLLGDADGDWDRDLADFAAFQRAFGGPGVTPANYNDLTFDFDRDGDVDADDFTEFAQRMTPPKDWSPPTGPCCLPDGGCTENTTARECVVDLGGSWLGSAGGACPDDCPAFGACCSSIDGSCSVLTEAQCLASGGTYQGDGTTCGVDACPFGQYHNTISPMTQLALAGPGLQLADDLTLEGTGARDLTYLDLRVYGNGGGAFDVTVELWTDCPGNGGTVIPGTTFTFTGVPDDGYVYTLVADPVDPPVTIPDTVWMVATFSTPESGWIIAEQAETGTTANVYAWNLPPWACNRTFGGGAYAGLWANLVCQEGASKARGEEGLRPAAWGLRSGGDPVLRMERVETPQLISDVGSRIAE